MSSGLTRQYAPDDVTFTVGTQPAVGVHKGSFLEMDRFEDTGKLDIGSDGEATMVVNPNQSGYFKVTLQQSSPTNDYYTTLFQALQAKNTAVGVVPIRLSDKNGTTRGSCVQGFVQKPTKVVFADGAEGREWTFITGYLITTPGSQNVAGA
jgi:hypothetical protein